MMSTAKSILLGAAAGIIAALGTWNFLKFTSSATGQTTPAQPLPVAAPAAATVKDHFYDVRDGLEYGYTAELSEAQKQAGQAANSIVMMTYAGVRDGKHQVHLRERKRLTAFECTAPCEIIKVISVIDVDELRHEAQTERMRATPKMIAAMALQDAINGRLSPYAQEYDGQPYKLWLDSEKGLIRTRFKPVAKS